MGRLCFTAPASRPRKTTVRFPNCRVLENIARIFNICGKK
jgi:hypothetical protein